MVRTLYWLPNLLLAQAAQDTAAAIRNDLTGNAREHTMYVRFGAGTASGAVVLEAADDPTFTGVWSIIGTVTWAVANSVKHVSVTGCHRALRVRISTVIGGGTVNVSVSAN